MLVFWGLFLENKWAWRVWRGRGGHGAGAKGLGTGNGCKKLRWERPERGAQQRRGLAL